MSGYSCGRALDQMSRITRALVVARALSSSSSAHLVHSWVESCSSCKAKGQWSKCLGWRFKVPETDPLVLGPFFDKGTSVTVALSADMDFSRRSPMNPVLWESAPVERANLTVRISGGSQELRYHVDLADIGQEGHVWHLQFGGKGTHHSATRLDLPRWPVAPLDFALLIDTILQNYSRTLWTRCWNDRLYSSGLLESDVLMRTAWVERMAAVGPGPRQGHFNGVFDNAASPAWDPRPSAAAVRRQSR